MVDIFLFFRKVTHVYWPYSLWVDLDLHTINYIWPISIKLLRNYSLLRVKRELTN